MFFSEIAANFGVEMELPTMGAPGVPPAGPMVHKNVWGKEKGLELIKLLKESYAPGDHFEYDGHGDCWLMLAALYELRRCDLNTYIAVFDKSLHIEPYAVGGREKPGLPVTFTLEEKGDDVPITANLYP